MPPPGPDLPTVIHKVTPADAERFNARLEALLLALEAHPQFAPRVERCPQQLFWVWDFVHCTHLNLSQIPRDQLWAADKAAIATYNDCWGRCTLADILIREKGPKAVTMFKGELVDFGPDIERLSRLCVEKHKDEPATGKKGGKKTAGDKKGAKAKGTSTETDNDASASTAKGNDDDNDWEDVEEADDVGCGPRKIKYNAEGRRITPMRA